MENIPRYKAILKRESILLSSPTKVANKEKVNEWELTAIK